jgi:hypothetical protein
MPVSEALTRDPMEFYANLAFLGLPMTCTGHLGKRFRAVFLSGPVSREMVQGLDEYVVNGGVAMLDALSARAYSLYGGNLKFTVNGPVAGHDGENCPDGSHDELIADLPPDGVFLLEGLKTDAEWTGHRSDGSETGVTSAVVPHGQGYLVLLGYDMGLSSRRLTRPVWRKRVLEMLDQAGVIMSTYWDGDPAVQVQKTGKGFALVNHNPSEAIGVFHVDGESREIVLAPREIKMI